MHTTKIIFKVVLTFIILNISFQSLTTANDSISDFQIEGMSIGESALDFYSRVEILKGTKQYFKSDRYTIVEIKKNLKLYDLLQFTFLTNDKTKDITSLSGIVYYRENIKNCYDEIDNIYRDVKQIFPNFRDDGKLTYKHSADKSGKSSITDYVLISNNKDEIQIGCTDFSKIHGGDDHLNIAIKTLGYRKFLQNEAY